MWTGMNHKKKNQITGQNKKQTSLSRSLFRSKAFKNVSNNTVQEHNSSTANSQNEQLRKDRQTAGDHSSSQPESDDCDDSFELFLPRRKNPKAPSTQSSFFKVKSRSRYFNESGVIRLPKVIKDDDLELALAVSLQESKGSTVSLKPPKTESILPRGKLKKACSNSLLMRRTPEERERIITEKVAIVLMNKGKDVSARGPSCRVDDSFSLNSALLKAQVYEMKTLWTLAQTDLSQVKLENFFIDVIIHYLPSTCMNDDDCFNTADASTDALIGSEPVNVDLQRAYSSEDLFGDSDSDLVPSPKRFCPSVSLEALDEPRVAISPNCSDNRSGEERLSLQIDSLDILTLEVEELDSSGNVKTSEVRDDNCPNSPTCIADDDPHSASVMSHQSSCIQRIESKSRDFAIHYKQLSADMLSVSKSRVSRVTEVTNGSKIFIVHHCIFEVRCPALLEDLENNPKCLTNFSSGICESLFAYIYAADITSCLKMDFNMRKELMECAKKYKIVSLAEELENMGNEENMEGVKIANSRTSEEDLSNKSFQNNNEVPVHLEISNTVHSTPKEVTFSKPHFVTKTEVKSEQVVTSDSGSVEVVVNSEGPVSECVVTEDEDLDIYLKDSMRLTEKRNLNQKMEEIVVSSDEACKTPIPALSAPEKSIDQYFQDSFPDIVFTPPPCKASKDNETLEPVPGSSKSFGVVDCVTPGGQLVVSERATPLPDYESMLSPELQVALHKYGIRRGIGRRKAVTLLRYIYDQIHPPADHPAVARAISDVKSVAQPIDKTTSDDDVYTLSSESSGDLQMFEDLGDVVTSPPSNTNHDRSSLQREIGGYIKSNTLLYAAILTYEPIWLNKFHNTIKDHGIKCNKKELMDVLDELGITFRTEQTEKQMKRKGSKRRIRQKR